MNETAGRLMLKKIPLRYLILRTTVPALLLFMAAVLFAPPATAQVTSVLWDDGGDEWAQGNNQLRDFSNVGYHFGDDAIPDETEWTNAVDVTDFGAVGDGETECSDAFRQAIAACPSSSAVFIPNGTYKITERIHVTTKNYFVLRGEDMYETILWFPEYMDEVYFDPDVDFDWMQGSDAFLHMDGGTHRSLENFSIVFRDQMNETHHTGLGSNGIRYSDVEHSWIRNIYIKNADMALSLGGDYLSAINIVLDQYEGRGSTIGEDGGRDGHHGLTFHGANSCLIHDCTITGNWYHDIACMDSVFNSVFSKITALSPKLDHHAMAQHFNLWTDIHATDYCHKWDASFEHTDETFWNITMPRPHDFKPEATYPDPSVRNVLVGVMTTDPSDITGADYWHETINDPSQLEPQNIYLAQLAKKGNKWIPPASPPPQLSGVDPNVIKPIDDNYIDNQTPDTCYHLFSGNRNPRMEVSSRYLGGADHRTGAMKFDLSSVEHTSVSSAILRVYCVEVPSGPVLITAVAKTNDAWEEHTLTWNTCPWDVEDGTRFATNLVDTSGQWVEWDITSYINSELAGSGDQVVTITLDSFSYEKNRIDFSTKDAHKNHPQILLIPEGSPMPDRTPPAAPIGLNLFAGDHRVTLNWNDNTDGDLHSYRIYRRTQSQEYDMGVPAAAGLVSSEYTDVRLDNGTEYYFVVTAVDANGNESNISEEFSVTPSDTPPPVDTTPPAAPTGLGATAAVGSVSLDWNDNSEGDLASYSVYRSTTSSNYSTALATGLSASDYVDNTTLNGTTYYYAVSATDTNSNESIKSTEDSATPTATAQNTWTGGGSNNNIEDANNWSNGVPNSVGNIGTIDTDPGGVIWFGSTNPGAFFVIQETGTVYEVGNHSFLAGGSWALNGGSFVHDGSGILRFDGGFGISINGGQLIADGQLDVTDSDDSITFEGGGYVGADTFTGSGILNWMPGSTAYMTVEVTTDWAEALWDAGQLRYNGDNNSDLSKTWADVIAAGGLGGGESFNYNSTTKTLSLASEPGEDTTPPAAPTGLSATAGDGQVSLTWTANGEGDLASYSVYRSTTSSNYSTALVAGLSASDYVDNTVVNGTTYYYAIAAVDTNSNESIKSTEDSATPSAPAAAQLTLIELNSGDLSGNSADPYHLSEWGQKDWKMWKDSLTIPEEKMAGGSGISALSYTPGAGGGVIGNILSGRAPYYSWTNGTPTATVTASQKKRALGSAKTASTGDRISFTVDASTGQSTLYLLAGVLEGAVTLTASLPGVADQTSEYVNLGNNGNFVLYKVDYTAGNESDELSIMLEKTQADSDGFIFIQAAAVSASAPVLTGYDLWATEWNTDIGAATNDLDGDGLSNLGEYALGGNPTNSAVQGSVPTFTKSGNGFIYVHPQRSDDAAITYWVETTTNLISGVWTTQGVVAVGTNVTGETINFVTNDVGTVEKDKFFRLKIEQ